MNNSQCLLKSLVQQQFEVAIAEGVEKAFTLTERQLKKNKDQEDRTLKDEIGLQVFLAVRESIQGALKGSVQEIVDKEVLSILQKGIHKQENRKYSVDSVKSGDAAKPEVKRPPSLKNLEGLIEVSTLSLRSPITPRVSIPDYHHAAVPQKIITTPLAFDAKRKVFSEIFLEDHLDDHNIKQTGALVIPKKLSLGFLNDTHPYEEGIETTPIKYSLPTMEIDFTEEAPDLSRLSTGSSSSSNSKRLSFPMKKQISIDTSYEHVNVNASLQEEDDGKSGYEDDNEDDFEGAEESPIFPPLSTTAIEPIQFGVKKSDFTISSLATQLRNALKCKSEKSDDVASSIPIECQTPTSKSRKEALCTGFSFTMEDRENNLLKRADSDSSTSPVCDLPCSKKKSQKSNLSIPKLMHLKGIYADPSPNMVSNGHFSSPVKTGEFAAPPVKRNKLSRASTTSSLRMSQDLGIVQECQTPHSKDLKNRSFEFHPSS
jgi:hypothetical protein